MQQGEEVNSGSNELGEPIVGWFKAMRTQDALELLAACPVAFMIAYIIATRANWRGGFNRHGCGPGEAMLGDFERFGWTEKQYRTGKKFLHKNGFAVFRRASKGTIGKLIDNRLFSIFENQKGEHGAVRGQSGGEHGATNEEVKND